jgi:hypothetical protein
MSKQSDGKRDLSGPLSIIVLSLLFLVVTAAAIWWLLPAPKSVAAFGEAFGGVVGTVISSFALVFLIFTVLQQQRALDLQRKELFLQRQELKETREELRRTADAHEASGQVLQKQVRIAQLAARLNAALALLDHYEKLYAKLPPDLSNPIHMKDRKKQEHRREVMEGLREIQAEIFRVRAQLLDAVQGSGVAIDPPPTASGTGVMTDPNV